jgi:glycosyltransferase involved in cell wall biosynthesis
MTASAPQTRRPEPSWPSVSVIVPTRDRPELLARAVRSILEQSYPGELACVVVFDQAEPAEPDVEVPPRRSLHAIENARAAGLAGARNTGILAATTDLVAFCDDDDEWLPGKLRVQVELLEATRADVGATGMAIVRDGKTVERIPPRPQLEHDELLRSRVQEVHPSSIIARRAALVDGPVGLVDEEIPGSYGEDYEWLLRATSSKPIAVVRSPLVRVHWHRSSFFADRWTTIIEAIQYLIGKHPELRSNSRGLARLYGRLAFANAALGRRAEARAWARRTLRLNVRERRAYLALLASTGLVSADTLMQLAHRTGRGI